MNPYPARAIVVVHGIGEQRRANALDALVRGLKRCGASGGELVQEPKEFGEPLGQEAIRVHRDGVSADVYEIFWAPHSARKTSAMSVLWWLLRTTFIPASKFCKPSAKTLWDATSAALWLMILAVVAVLALTSLGNLSAQVNCQVDPEVECEVPVDQRSVTGPKVTWGGFGQVSAIFEAIATSLTSNDEPLKNLTPEHAAEVLKLVPWRYWLLLLAIGFLVAQAVFRVTQIITALVQGSARYAANRLGWQLLLLLALVAGLGLLVQLIAPLMTAFLIVFLTVTGLLRSAARFLAESLGDVQIYSERDENKEHYTAREAILAEADKTFHLLARRGYSSIVVVGHSLGSVIALTAFDRLRWRIPSLISRIEVFVTLGTALEKVRYFLERRKEVDEDASQRLIEPTQKLAEQIAWLNLWYANDVVANPITTFNPPEQSVKNYRHHEIPPTSQLRQEAKENFVVNIDHGYPVMPVPLVWTHSRYWGDHKVMELITDLALPTTAS
ncbi:MAG: hypothetical protein M3N53_12865 [Actinomycetota bacterium]|nr:hypothetical protein [Actinomycetota bacterium]